MADKTTKKEDAVTKEAAEPKEAVEKKEASIPTCGIIMPISEIDGCSVDHWLQVKAILLKAINDAGFKGDLVSNSSEVNFIHKTIVNNIYGNDLVICDVSGKNPNVMFELGIRLTFDKPTIIIKDDATNYSFDTSPIEHLPYPRDLNYHRIVEFSGNLVDKIKDTHEKAKADANYSPFLKHLGNFVTPRLEEKEVPFSEFIAQSIEDLRNDIGFLRRDVQRNKYKERQQPINLSDFAVTPLHEEKITKLKIAFGGELNQAAYENIRDYISNRFTRDILRRTTIYNEVYGIRLEFTEPVPKRILNNLLNNVTDVGSNTVHSIEFTHA